eukprot:1186177-Prorocentrum_minimum.AAC.2
MAHKLAASVMQAGEKGFEAEVASPATPHIVATVTEDRYLTVHFEGTEGRAEGVGRGLEGGGRPTEHTGS